MAGQRRSGRALLLTAITITTIAPPSHAQRAGDGFLFQAPNGTWTFRGGFAHAMASSDIFTFATDWLTIDRSDFSSPTIGTSLGIRVSQRNELMFDVTYASLSRGSEFRRWVDQDERPIEQTTSLRRIPLTIGLRHYLVAPGHGIGRFAWIPARRALYVGAAAGVMEYKFRQVGDFIDFTDPTPIVFHDDFVAQGWTPVAHAAAGLDVALGSFYMVNLETRYTWAKAPMGADFKDFDHMDLSGLSVTAGFTFRLF